MRPGKKARVLVVEDHPIFREGLVQLIDRQDDLGICAEVGDAREALEAAGRHSPDMIVLDLMLKGTGGLDLLKDLKALAPNVPVLVLSMHEEAVYAERALRAGASGYLMKQEASSTVVGAIRALLAGKIHVSRAVEVTLMQKGLAVTEKGVGVGIAKLSNRELQIFELIGARVSTRDIARRLGVSIKTIETHRGNIKIKLALVTGAELATNAQEWVRGT